jgi:hypothetical protein
MPLSQDLSKTLKKELAKLEAERDRMNEVITHLRETIEANAKATGASAKKAVRKSTGRKPSAKSKRKAGSVKATPPRTARQEEIYVLITKNPGITAAELAKKAKLKQQTSIYPLLRKLTEVGDIKKVGKGYQAK